LRRGIAEVEMYPDKIRVARRDVGLREIMQRLPQPVAEREGERWTTVTHTLRGNLIISIAASKTA
jgi:hypothetical protein